MRNSPRPPDVIAAERAALGGDPSLNGEDNATLDEFVNWIHRMDGDRFRRAADILVDVNDLVEYGEFVVRTERDWDEVDDEWDGEVAPIRPVVRAVYDGDSDVDLLEVIAETLPHSREEANANDAKNRQIAMSSGRSADSVYHTPVQGGTTGSKKKVGRRFVPPRIGVEELTAKTRALPHHPNCGCLGCKRHQEGEWRRGRYRFGTS